MSTPQIMQMQLVGRGDVVVLTIPGDVQVSVAISDTSFVEGIRQLLQQAKHHPLSSLSKLQVNDK